MRRRQYARSNKRINDGHRFGEAGKATKRSDDGKMFSADVRRRSRAIALCAMRIETCARLYGAHAKNREQRKPLFGTPRRFQCAPKNLLST